MCLFGSYNYFQFLLNQPIIRNYTKLKYLLLGWGGGQPLPPLSRRHPCLDLGALDTHPLTSAPLRLRFPVGLRRCGVRRRAHQMINPALKGIEG